MAKMRTLGLDIGSNSIGWALIDELDGKPVGLAGMGVRIFEEGANLDAKSGKTESRNVKRREARLRRRQVARHALRKRRVQRVLSRAGLLPSSSPNHDDPAWKPLLDQDPYVLRAKALNQKLAPMELGRVFYHLAERRGFQTNRKKPATKEEHGVVKDGINKLSAEMQASGAQTLGEYFSRLNPHEIRIRTHYTRREWYKEEFDKIWNRQRAYHPAALTEGLRAELHHELFHQRPLLIRAGMLGHCELEPQKRRAPMALLDAQEFRILQELNNLRIDDETPEGRLLTPEQRQAVLDLQQREAKVTFAKIRKIDGLKKAKFNLERGERKDISGNRTSAMLRGAIGTQWDELDRLSRERLVNDLLSIHNEDDLCRRLSEHWRFDDAAVQLLSEVALEDDYASLSSSAIRKLLPHMRAGKTYREAIDAVPWETKPLAQESLLPPLENLRNPIVQRALAEMRRVVNALIARYGRPDRIRVELARELKLNKEDRAEHIRNMREREAEREKARNELIAEGLPEPKARDIEKWLLCKECGGRCPYTGKPVGFHELFRTNEFDVEHILPFSRSFDDSFANKTICHVRANRIEKRNQTPFEVYGATAEWAAILDRVRKFTGSFAASKLRRFELEDLDADADFLGKFTERQLNDTKYAAVKAAKYLRVLYPDDERLSAVRVTSGRVTAYLRNAWDLNRILSDGPRKSRDDHRHHAVDALCVALTDEGVIHQLSLESARWAQQGRRVGSFRGVPPPWAAFYADAEKAVRGIVVSHRVSRKVQGQLHQETHYGIIRDPHAGKTKNGSSVAVLRVRLEELSVKDVALIVDAGVRRAVEAKLKGGDPKKVFKGGQNLPVLQTKQGRTIPIKRVRIKYGKLDLLKLSPDRNVMAGSNHHLAIYAGTKNGKDIWTGEVVSLFDARQRVQAGVPVVRKQDDKGNPLVMSLVQGDTVELSWNGSKGFAKVMGLSENDYTFRWITDARKKADLGASLIRIRSMNALRDCGLQKLSVDALGAFHCTRD